MNGLRGFASLRTRPSTAYRAPVRERRYCLLCRKPLAHLNTLELCFACDDEFGEAPKPDYSAKLTAAQRQAIYGEFLAGATKYALAQSYGVSNKTIRRTIAAIEERIHDQRGRP